jgi:hypothetical protein
MRVSVARALLFGSAAAVLAHSDRGTITGTISDPAGAVIANAAVEARNTETGAVYPVDGSATGNYTIAELPAGTCVEPEGVGRSRSGAVWRPELLRRLQG